MFGSEHREIADLRRRVSQLELELANEKSARLADRLDVMGRMDKIREELAGEVGKLKPVNAVRAFRNARDFAVAVEREEGVG